MVPDNSVIDVIGYFVPWFALFLITAVVGALISTAIPAVGMKARGRMVGLLVLALPVLVLLYLSPPFSGKLWRQIAEPRLQPRMTVNLMGCVHRDGAEYEWRKSFVAKPGDRVNLLIECANTGMGQADNVVTRVGQPAQLTPEPLTAYWGNFLHPEGIPATGRGDGTALFTNGLNLGDYSSGATVWVIIEALVPKTRPTPSDGLTARTDGLATFAPVAFARCDRASEVSGTCEIQVKY